MAEESKKIKEKYLKEWSWESSFSEEYRFDVWTHKRWPNIKYKLDRAYDVMKQNEPSFKPALTANVNNEKEMNKVKYFTHRVINNNSNILRCQ